MPLLRADLLKGRTIALAGGLRPALRDALAGLGASVELMDVGDELDDDERAEQWVRARAQLDALVFDADANPDAGSADGGPDRLHATLERAWTAIRAVSVGALIPAQATGKIILLAPGANTGPYAEAARSALENLARTLSIEWARYGITTTAIAPRAAATDEQLATLVSFLLSSAGDYFSGCRFELGSSLIRAS
jgi:NAD(P)-dependent dehydrogenase (short-subunit alcohol dehydrogenase family)